MKIRKMKKRYSIPLVIIGIVLLVFGFTEGMEWYRLLSLVIGGMCLGVVFIFN